MRIIVFKGLRAAVGTLCVAVVILAALCWGLPRIYALLGAEGDDEFRELEDPVRVEAAPDPENTADWLKAFSP